MIPLVMICAVAHIHGDVIVLANGGTILSLSSSTGRPSRPCNALVAVRFVSDKLQVVMGRAVSNTTFVNRGPICGTNATNLHSLIQTSVARGHAGHAMHKSFSGSDPVASATTAMV